MQFICGVVDKTGSRRIFSAESTPTLENIDDVAGDAPVKSYDWGPGASVEASEWAARSILSCVTDRDEADLLASKYAEEVVRVRLDADRMWILPEEEVQKWLTENRRLM